MLEGFNPTRLEELSSIDLVREADRTGERVERIEEIPVARISSEVLIVNEEHVKELSQSMSGPRGQITTIAVRARIGGKTENDVGYDVIDGFHRVEAAKSLGWPTIQAKVLYGCSDEEMYDLRILASTVRSVSYARMASWMKGTWSNVKTPWREKISLAQACALADDDSSGKKLGLSPIEAEEVKRWVQDKAKRWSIPLGTLARRFSIIDLAAPDLVGKVRLRGGKPGKERGSFTPQKLGIIARAFPGEFEPQRQIASFAVDSAVSTEELQAIVEEISTLKKDRSDKEAVSEVLHDGRWKSSTYRYSPEREPTLSQLLSFLTTFETFLSRYPSLEKTVKEDIFYHIWLIRNKIQQAGK